MTTHHIFSVCLNMSKNDFEASPQRSIFRGVASKNAAFTSFPPWENFGSRCLSGLSLRGKTSRVASFLPSLLGRGGERLLFSLPFGEGWGEAFPLFTATTATLNRLFTSQVQQWQRISKKNFSTFSKSVRSRFWSPCPLPLRGGLG